MDLPISKQTKLFCRWKPIITTRSSSLWYSPKEALEGPSSGYALLVTSQMWSMSTLLMDKIFNVDVVKVTAKVYKGNLGVMETVEIWLDMLTMVHTAMHMLTL